MAVQTDLINTEGQTSTTVGTPENTVPNIGDIYTQEQPERTEDMLNLSNMVEECKSSIICQTQEAEGDYTDWKSSDSDQNIDSGSEYESSNDESGPPRRGRARTARECIAKLHQKQDETWRKQEQSLKKRAAYDVNDEPNKRQKTTHTATTSEKLSSLKRNSNIDFDETEPTCSQMPEIQATTHQKQFELLNRSIPAGADTRRTRTQKLDLMEAVSIFGYKKVKAVNGDWNLKGMESALKHHQLTAAAWMVKRECDRVGPFGGILADVMGLGKTITSLACVIGNPPEDDDLATYTSATLVIVPSEVVVGQWKSEIKKHYGDPIADSLLVYRLGSDVPPQMFEKVNIVYVRAVTRLLRQLVPVV